MKKQYIVGIKFSPNGEVLGTCGLIGGREISNIRNKITLNKKRETYIKAIYDSNKKLYEIWKLNKKEYENLHCGTGLFDSFI